MVRLIGRTFLLSQGSLGWGCFLENETWGCYKHKTFVVRALCQATCYWNLMQNFEGSCLSLLRCLLCTAQLVIINSEKENLPSTSFILPLVFSILQTPYLGPSNHPHLSGSSLNSNKPHWIYNPRPNGNPPSSRYSVMGTSTDWDL